jgi:photosystem II stability/assembly factor-like uncharacterized protein
LSGTKDELNAVCFLDTRHGWTVGNGGALYRTSDGGRHWTLNQLNPAMPLGAVSFSDARHGWIVAAHAALLATSDAGATWSVATTFRSMGHWAMFSDVAAPGGDEAVSAPADEHIEQMPLRRHGSRAVR